MQEKTSGHPAWVTGLSKLPKTVISADSREETCCLEEDSGKADKSNFSDAVHTLTTHKGHFLTAEVQETELGWHPNRAPSHHPCGPLLPSGVSWNSLPDPSPPGKVGGLGSWGAQGLGLSHLPSSSTVQLPSDPTTRALRLIWALYGSPRQGLAQPGLEEHFTLRLSSASLSKA